MQYDSYLSRLADFGVKVRRGQFEIQTKSLSDDPANDQEPRDPLVLQGMTSAARKMQKLANRNGYSFNPESDRKTNDKDMDQLMKEAYQHFRQLEFMTGIKLPLEGLNDSSLPIYERIEKLTDVMEIMDHFGRNAR